ncbi:hypothetical protein GPECTOR_84g310 [Gonium pectorale]|uniref:C-terminal of Roc COR-B domain-containing protein n=1 Tax=Gonium pectorale TaxID=33097 RepID=A0A150G1D6_GONPE|nr:hypothetical protein GPECTOR_84g310 [Gonium pectorale]|eukprot:KXZ43634.1 hypothetical protein GPECTOR_84g310 [Gonium pectorale]
MQTSGPLLHIAAEKGHLEAVAALLQAGADKDAADETSATPLHIAAENGHVEVVAALLQAGANKEAAAETGATALYIAAENGHEEVVRVLLQAGANKDAADETGATPLHIAAQNGHVEAIAALLQAGANKDAADETGATPLHIAAQDGHVEAVAALLQAGANTEAADKAGANKEAKDKTGATPLHIAANNGHVEAVAALLQAGADKEAANKTGATPLHIAAQKGHVEAVAALLRAGANKEAATKTGATPLHIAAQDGHVEAVAALLQAGANMEAATKDGATPLYIAAYSGHVEAIAALLQAGANKDAAKEGCWTPLHLACLDGDLARVQQLLQRGAPVDAAGKGGWTPLHLALCGGSTEAVERLLGAGASATRATALQDSPLHFAAQLGKLAAAKLLLEKADAAGQLVVSGDAGFDVANVDGDTPLHNASHAGQTGVVQALLRAGAPLEVRNNDGLTPLHRACQRGHRDVVEALLRAGADHEAKTNDGKTPLDLARAEGFSELAELLLQHDNDIATSIMGVFWSSHAIFMSPEAVYITVYNSRGTGLAASVDAYLERVQTLAPGARNMVVGTLSDFGELLQFQHVPGLEDKVVIDPEWLADVLADVVTRDQDKQRRLQLLEGPISSMPVGHVSLRKVHEAMEARCPGHANELVRILEEYGLLYDLGDGERAIIPPSLPTLKADAIETFLWEESPGPNEQPLRWWGATYTFDKHLPDALLCRLLCRLLSLPELRDIKLEHMWRFGVFLKQGAKRIVVAYDPEQRPKAGPLSVYTCGPEPELLGLLVASQLAQVREQFPGVKCVECREASDMSMYALDEQAVDWYPVKVGRQGRMPRGMVESQGESEGTLKIRRSLGAMERVAEQVKDMPDGTALVVELRQSLVRRAVALHKLVGPSGGEYLPLAVLLPAPDDGASIHRMELDVDSNTSGLPGSVRLHALCEGPGGLHLTDHPGYEVKEGRAWLRKHGRGLRPLLRALRLAGVSGPVGTLGVGNPEEEAMDEQEMQRTHSRGRSGVMGEDGPTKQLDYMLACLDRLMEQQDAQLRTAVVSPAAEGKGDIEGRPADLYSACQEACSSIAKIVRMGNMEAGGHQEAGDRPAAGSMPHLRRVVTRTAGAMWLCACHAEEVLGRTPLRSL